MVGCRRCRENRLSLYISSSSGPNEEPLIDESFTILFFSILLHWSAILWQVFCPRFHSSALTWFVYDVDQERYTKSIYIMIHSTYSLIPLLQHTDHNVLLGGFQLLIMSSYYSSLVLSYPRTALFGICLQQVHIDKTKAVKLYRKSCWLAYHYQRIKTVGISLHKIYLICYDVKNVPNRRLPFFSN